MERIILLSMTPMGFRFNNIKIKESNFNDLIKIKSKYLLPYPYISSKLPETSKINDNIKLFEKKN